MRKVIYTLSVLAFATTMALSCGGGGGDSSSTTSGDITISGTVRIAQGQPGARMGVGSIYSSPLAYTTAVLTGANVTLCKPTPSGIVALSDVPATQSTASGGYTIITSRQVAEVESGQPLFVCASNAGGTFSLISLIPSDKIVDGGTIRLSVSPETTLVGKMVCPGGIFPPVTGPCYTVNSEHLEDMEAAIGLYLVAHPELAPYADNFSPIMSNMLDDSSIGATVATVAGEYGVESTASGQTYCSPPLPIVYSPSSGDTAPTVPTDDTDFDVCFGGGGGTGGGTDTEPEPEPEDDDSSPFYGFISGSWSGSCVVEGYGTYGISGTFIMNIAANGGVTGAYSGGDAGSLSGSVSSSGSFAAGGGSVSAGSWSGKFTASGSSLSGSGGWSGSDSGLGAVCSGSWSGSGTKS